MNSFQNKRDLTGSGFTLVELLLVMAIIGVLSSLALVVVNEAQYDARVSATRSRINMLDQIMRQRVDGFQEMRMPLDLTPFVITDNGDVDRELARELKRRIIADMIDVEMPRSYWDIAWEPSDADDRDCTFPSRQFRKWLVNGTSISQNLLRQLGQRTPSNARRFRFGRIENGAPYDRPDLYPEGREFSELPFLFDPTDPTTIDFNRITSVSEYLYIILQSTQFNGISAIETLGNRAFADTDGDGFREVVDSWGNPIGFQFELNLDNGVRVPIDLDTSFILNQEYEVPFGGEIINVILTDDSMYDVENIRIRLVSTGGKSTFDGASRELITN